MPPLPALSKGEMAVASALWKLKSATVREVHERVLKDRPMDFATVQTYLRRLEAKGYLSVKLVDRVNTYRPKTSPARVIQKTVGDLVDRLFGGEALPLVRHLVAERKMSPGDLEELKNLIQEHEKQNQQDKK